MEGMFDFVIGPAIRFQVRQKVSEFEWGRKLAYSTAYSTDIEYGTKMVSRLLVPLVPRTAIRSEFEASHAGTVLTVEVAVWVLPLGGNDVSRALISDGLLQALARLKRNIEHSEPARFSPWIFFNYRRNDAEFAADRIYDSIKREFGEGATFRDLYHLKLGTDFADELRDSVRRSRVFLAVIGPEWLRELKSRVATSTISSPYPETDWVLEELVMALGSKRHGSSRC
jgi:hypothetical protein